MLENLVITPPGLLELDVLFDLSYEHPQSVCDVAVLDSASHMRYCASSWRQFSPSLRSIRCWDWVAFAQSGMWHIISFLLRDFLATEGLELTVNLTLTHADESRFRRRFDRQKRLRRLLGKDVF
ncbi:hypothetical protein AURDEDRAFT_171714 [Auricularia subglabra TFB-10046 SS5]|nr:hypothetical protein AURDEDRAFT_171714 [Auricularia subglabra TFB-10046 SS5]